MTDFSEIRFPTSISYGARGGATFNTDVVTSYTGHEQRNINWDKARAKYTISLASQTQSEIDEVIAFFYARKGKAIGFRFKDWMDYKATNQFVGISDGDNTDYQLYKTYINGSVEYKRTINKPVEGSVVVYVDDIEQTEDSDYTVDYSDGIITFDNSSIPSADSVITADFEFDVPVRFDTDELAISTNDLNSNTWSGINLVELRI